MTNRFKVEKQSGRSGYWRVLDTMTGVYVEAYCSRRDSARGWQKVYEDGSMNFALEQRNLPRVGEIVRVLKIKG